MQSTFKEIASLMAPHRRIYFEPLYGNHGDTLIRIGATKFLRDHGKELVDDPTAADLVVVNGGGAMCDLWGGLTILKRYIEAGLSEIVVLPSSFWCQDEFAEILHAIEGSAAKVTLFARERASFDRLTAGLNNRADIRLGHDMAFYLTAGDIVPLLNTGSRKSYTLVVERRDAEASTNIAPAQSWDVPFKAFVPIEIKRWIKRQAQLWTSNQTVFVKQCLALANEQDLKSNRIIIGDVSQPSLYSFKQFLRLVSNADVVFTTRLHVAILRHIFGRPCYLRPTGGEYSKNEAVFEYSMSNAGHVRLLAQ